jgi:hypothetical protein
MRNFSFLSLALLALGLSGCGTKPSVAHRCQVTGQVLVDGKPLPYGRIAFIPETGKTLLHEADVTEGRFALDTVAGKKHVAIWGYTIGNTPGSPPVIGPRENYLPDEYNRATTLSADVIAGGSNDFTFEVQSH